jgi:hypothetical protein
MQPYLEQFKDLSEEALIRKMHEFREWSEPYRAASQLLKLKQRERETKMTKDSSRLVHFTLWILAIAILTLIATVFFGVDQLRDEKTQSKIPQSKSSEPKSGTISQSTVTNTSTQ